MNWQWYPAPAKLNLFLHVLGPRPDGYHELQTAFRLIDRADRVGIAARADGEIRFSGDYGDDNLVVRAAHLLRERAGCKKGNSRLIAQGREVIDTRQAHNPEPETLMWMSDLRRRGFRSVHGQGAG